MIFCAESPAQAKLFIDNRPLIMYYNSKHLNIAETGQFCERSGKTQAIQARSRRIDMKTKMRKWIAVLAAVALLAMAVTPTVCALSFFSTFDELMGGDFGDILSELLGGNNGNNGNNGQNGFTLSDLLQNPGGMLDTLRERLADLDVNASNSTIAEALMALLEGSTVSDLREMLNSNDFINQLADYIEQQQATSTTGTNTPSGNTPSGNTPSGNTPSGGNDPTTAYNPSSNYPTDINTPSIVIPSVSYTYTYQGAQTYTTDPSSTASTTAVSTTAGDYSYADPSVSYTNALTTVPFTPVYEDSTPEKSGSGTKLVIGIGVLLVSAGAVVALVVMLKKNKA